MCPLTYLSSPLTRILHLRLNRSLSGKFLIVDLVFGTKPLRGCFSPCKLFRVLLFVFIEVSISERCLVEHKGVYCLMFP